MIYLWDIYFFVSDLRKKQSHYIAIIHEPGHWTVLIVDNLDNKYYFIDPLCKRQISEKAKLVIDNLQKTGLMKTDNKLSSLKHSIQPGCFECGYYCLIVILLVCIWIANCLEYLQINWLNATSNKWHCNEAKCLQPTFIYMIVLDNNLSLSMVL